MGGCTIDPRGRGAEHACMNTDLSGSRSDDEFALSSVCRRLRRLERGRRRERALFGVLVLLVAVGAWAGPQVVEKVQARAFELVDADGAVRAQLYFDKSGDPRLEILDDRDVPRIRFGMFGEVVASFLADRKGDNRIAQTVDSNSDASVFLTMPGGKPAAQLGVSGRGGAGISFTHRSGYMNAGLGLQPNGKAWLIQRELPPGVDPETGRQLPPGKEGDGESDGGKKRD